MATTSPGSTSPTTDLDDDLTDLPGFGPSQSRPTSDPLDPETTTITEPSLPDGWMVDENGVLNAVAGPSRASTPTSGRSPASTAELAKSFAEITHLLVGLVSLAVRFVRTRRQHLPDEVWIADKHDQAAIGDPLARIAARHSPLESGDTTDVADGLMATVGIAGYAVKNLTLEQETATVLPDLTVPDGPPSL
jgi:hypothetical protein